MIKLTSPFLNLPYLVLFYCASFYFSNHRTFSLSTSARIRTQYPGQRVSPRWSATDHPWAPCFNEIEGPIVLTLTKRVFPRYWGSHVFGIEGFLVKEVAIEDTQRYLSTYSVLLSCNSFIESFLSTFPQKLSDPSSVYNRQSICLQLTEYCAQPTE